MRPGPAIRLTALAALCGLTGCAAIGVNASRPASALGPAPEPVAVAPLPRPAARSVEDFDTTTAEQRSAAGAAAATPGERSLGRSVAALGDPTQPGFWVRSPLVNTPGPGRVVDTASGASVQADLLPLPGDPGAGSQISLAALRLLGLPLTALPELELFAR